MDTIHSAVQYWVRGGGVLAPIAGVCFFIWFYFFKLNSRMQKFLSVPDLLVEESNDMLQKKIMKEESCSLIRRFMQMSENRFLSRVFSVMEQEKRGLFKSIDRARMIESRTAERQLIVMKALVASSPLMGLLGTVLGMITTFNALGTGMSGATEIMASGISKALITTQFGLITALPGIFLISILERNMRSIEVRFDELRTHCMSGMRKRNAV